MGFRYGKPNRYSVFNTMEHEQNVKDKVQQCIDLINKKINKNYLISNDDTFGETILCIGDETLVHKLFHSIQNIIQDTPDDMMKNSSLIPFLSFQHIHEDMENFDLFVSDSIYRFIKIHKLEWK